MTADRVVDIVHNDEHRNGEHRIMLYYFFVSFKHLSMSFR